MTDLISEPDGGEVAPLYPTVSKDSVIGLREAGRSYAAIARQLTMPNAREAQAAFVRAIRQRSDEERAGLVQRELGRLEVLEKKIRADADDDSPRAKRRLSALNKLRTALQKAPPR